MNEFNIQTAQNVTINQNIAPVTTRIKAFLLDLLIIIGYYIIVFFTLNFLDFLDSENLTVILVVMGLPVFFYHLLFEVFMDGQTPGKYWTSMWNGGQWKYFSVNLPGINMLSTTVSVEVIYIQSDGSFSTSSET